ncbi:MAG TPA: hypothetical protein VG370_30690 [Chloroflexota bacterium]|nr:hypothetical protein [Chloroflexota bacterium]
MIENPLNKLLERITEGMTVVDAAGEKLGTVAFVKMGEGEGVATTAGDELGFRAGRGIPTGGGVQPGGVFVAGQGTPGASDTAAGGLMATNFGPVPAGGDARAEERLNVFEEPEPDVEEPLRSRLLRSGFIKIDGYGPGFLDVDRYVAAEQIAAVGDDTVKLTLRKDEIPRERGGR